MVDLKIKTEDGYSYILKSPPAPTKETVSKLHRTAELLYEISKLWNIPDRIMGEELDEFNPSNAETGSEALHRSMLLDWYQEQPFVPVFFNSSYYAILKGKMAELGVEDSDRIPEGT